MGPSASRRESRDGETATLTTVLPGPAGGIAEAVRYRISGAPVAYPTAVAEMEERVARIASGTAPELVWLCEHPPLYTAGTSAKPGDLLAAERFPVYATGRGGQYTYHGPGQRVAYVMVDVRQRFGGDVRAFVRWLEAVVIDTLAAFAVTGGIREGRVGVWVDRSNPAHGAREDKIAAIGIRIRRGVSFHGVAINVDPDLEHFSGIVPCGLPGFGVTSLTDLGVKTTMTRLDEILLREVSNRLGNLELEHPTE